MEEKKKENTMPCETGSVETALEQLEKLISRLESKECTLEESFHLYKEGVGLVQYCNQAISQVEQQLVILNEEGEVDGF